MDTTSRSGARAEECTQRLKRHYEGGDPVIREAREQLRAEFPPVH